MPLISWRPADNAVMLSERTAHLFPRCFRHVKFVSVSEPQGENMKGLRACMWLCAERVRGARAGASLEGDETGVTAT